MVEVKPIDKRACDVFYMVIFFLGIILDAWMFGCPLLLVKDLEHVEDSNIIVKFVSWYVKSFDPILLERPPFVMGFLWIYELIFVPFYIAAIYAFYKGFQWIKVPTICYASSIGTFAILMIFEEFSNHIGYFAIFLYGLVLVYSAALIWKMARCCPFECCCCCEEPKKDE